MPAAKDFYVAIELGSSKVTGIAGQKKMDGSITVLAVATEDSMSLIRRGTVYNIEKTNQCIRRIVQKLQNQLQTEIKMVHVGLGGQSIRTIQNNIINDFDEATVVSLDIIDAMCDANRGTKYTNQYILDVVPQEYKVDLQYQTEPVGIECNRIEGSYLNIVWRETFYRNLCKCFEEQSNMPNTRYYIAPLALADSLLTESERRNGCMLVDLGAGTTTVSIYYKNILRHMATIPLGGLNITKDISAFHIDEADAERLKLKHALAYVNASEVDAETKLSIDIQRTISQREFLSMAEARTEEIIKNALAQIPTEYEDKLIGGIILTGGMANMRNIEQAFRIYSKCENIRIANKVKTSVNYAKQVTNTSDISCTALSLLLKADELSSGRSLDEISIFSEPEESEPVVEQPRPRELKPGEVPTGREREQTEKEAAAKAEQEAAKVAGTAQGEEEEKAQGRSFFSKMKDNAMKVVKKLIEEEEDER